MSAAAAGRPQTAFVWYESKDINLRMPSDQVPYRKGKDRPRRLKKQTEG